MSDSSRGKSTDPPAPAPTGAAAGTAEAEQAAGAPGVIPLVRRFPALASVPRVHLGAFPTPVMRVNGITTRAPLWIKRDDLDAPLCGGNKVRALEYLLAGIAPGDTVLTAGGEGSTHILATATMARALGVRTVAVRWRHDMGPSAEIVAGRARRLCERIYTARGAVTGLAATAVARMFIPARWIPLGGTTPLAMLGHVNAALELAEQVAAGELPLPRYVVLPLGTGGTTAGLALGFAIAGFDTTVVGVRVVPRLVGNARRVHALVRGARDLIERLARTTLPRVPPRGIVIEHRYYGGAYGRVLPAARAAAAELARAAGIPLDDTYSAKAFAAALDLARRDDGPVLFWLTFGVPLPAEAT